MADVAGVQDEAWLSGQSVDLVLRRLQRGHNIRIGCLVEAHVAVTDLDKAQLAFGLLLAQFSKPAEAVRLEHAALHHAKGPGAGPSHALKKSATINAVMVVVMQDYIILFFRHALLLGGRRLLSGGDWPCRLLIKENLFVDLTSAAPSYSRVVRKNVKN